MYTINEVAERLNLNSQTLRKWENDFELKIPRNDMGHRYYTDREIEILENIKIWKEKGATKKIINEYLGKTDKFKEQKEQALDLITLNKLTGKEIKELMSRHIAEILIEREEKLKEEFKKELEQIFEQQQYKTTEKVIKQVKAENQKLMNYIAKIREEDKNKKGFWKKLFYK
ncbi:helix-turn-helix domain-containing protein [Tepidibacter thalassicus]|uniref:DNA-binding transcriptional regulator, MerR family n=1 Tax=Tepidibacter thalassicus DSM 15285 TaxID=1123350 RepID=A0A1M5SU32_9FIRM|nr:helix-turn-helix domain-containing protein [Tepidibacter thalassicus]SHH42014.1 DNA-binding transcriptional regulator, MerR family [Tepidibacter thalassicus DSM 15285]